MRDRSWALAFFVVPLASLLLLAYCTPSQAEALEPEQTAIVAVHGGGWYGGTPAKMDRVCQDVAPALGYDCFQPSYTLSGVAPYSQQLQDLSAYVANLRTQGYTRIIGIGSSAGGNLVGLLASHDLIEAAVTLSAPSNLTADLPDWYRTQCSCWVVDQYAPTQGKKENASPALDTVPVPIYIIHSADEELIPVKQAWHLRVASPLGQRLTLTGTRHGMAYFDDVSDDIIGWVMSLD
jgi:acetyl esterase/lipase